MAPEIYPSQPFRPCFHSRQRVGGGGFGGYRTQSGDTWRFDVTLRHADTGWDHYADGWRILSMDGAELGTQILVHPHVNEMPFTRSLSGVEIPQGMTRVLVVAKDNLADWGAQNYEVNLLAE